MRKFIAIVFYLNIFIFECFGGVRLHIREIDNRAMGSEAARVKVSGSVTDAETGEKLPGSTVSNLNENINTITNASGYYSLSMKAGNQTTFRYSFVGYKTITISISSQHDTTVNIQLAPEAIKINEVQVTGQRSFWGNMENARNISTLSAKDIRLVNSNNPADVLQASMPGVWSTNTSGAPGDHQKVRIRGINTIFGCADPLYIIDGVAVPIVNLHSMGIADVNLYDIENVTVLKDAASAALYGFQGGNGVVILDTRKITGNSISFTAKFGMQQMAKRYDLRSTSQYYTAIDSSVPEYFSSGIINNKFPLYSETLDDVNWQNTLFRFGATNEYQLSCMRKKGKTGFYVSGNYFKQKGVVTNSGYSKYTVNGKISRAFAKKMIVNLSYRGCIQENKNNLDTYNGSNLIIENLNKPPFYKNITDSMYYSYSVDKPPVLVNRNYYDYKLWLRDPVANYPCPGYPVLNNEENPDSLLSHTVCGLTDRSNAISLVAKYQFSNNLFINASSSITWKNRVYKYQLYHDIFNYFGNYMKSHENYVLLSQQININYNKTYRGNSFSAVAGYRNYADNAFWNLDTIKDKYNVQQTWISNSLVINTDRASVTRQINSLAMHLNYNYRERYFLSLLANYERLNVNSQAQGIGNLFPSVALSWDLARERNLENIIWLDKLNLFANYGMSGNYPINALSKDFYDSYRYYYYNDTVVESLAVTQFANHYLKPEIVHEYNLGTDISLFKGRLGLTIDYYHKTNDNLTILRDIPLCYGGGKELYNIGKVTNIGKDISLKAELIRTQQFSWISEFNFSTNNQVINKMGNVNKMEFANANDILIPRFEVAVNSEVGVIKGYKYIGPWTEEDNNQKNKYFKKNYESKYLGVDTTSKVLNSGDQVVIGKTLPDYYWNWNNQLTYKNISVEFLWYAVIGVNKYNATKASTYMSGLNQGTDQFIERDDGSLKTNAIYQSSFFVEDASFVRLKRATVSYRFSRKVFKYANLSLSLSFDNLITLTHYSGYDPEASIYTDNSFSDFGIDRGAYPNSRAVYFSINLQL